MRRYAIDEQDAGTYVELEVSTKLGTNTWIEFEATSFISLDVISSTSDTSAN